MDSVGSSREGPFNTRPNSTDINLHLPTIQWQSTTETTAEQVAFFPGNLVWAKFTGFPWWPGKVAFENRLPANVLALKHTSSQVPVQFFATHDYAWMGTSDDVLRPYEPFLEKFGKQKKPAGLVLAIKESRTNPDILGQELPLIPKPDVNTHHETPSSSSTGGESVSPSRREGNKRRTGSPPPSRKKSSASLSSSKKSSTSPKKSSPAATTAIAEELVAMVDPPAPKRARINPDESMLERCARFRVKLQKFLQHPGPRSESDFEKASSYLSQVENISDEVDISILKETKLGKVIKYLTKNELEGDSFAIVQRCKDLFESWRLRAVIQSPSTQEEPNEDGLAKQESSPPRADLERTFSASKSQSPSQKGVDKNNAEEVDDKKNDTNMLVVSGSPESSPQSTTTAVEDANDDSMTTADSSLKSSIETSEKGTIEDNSSVSMTV